MIDRAWRNMVDIHPLTRHDLVPVLQSVVDEILQAAGRPKGMTGRMWLRKGIWLDWPAKLVSESSDKHYTHFTINIVLGDYACEVEFGVSQNESWPIPLCWRRRTIPGYVPSKNSPPSMVAGAYSQTWGSGTQREWVEGWLRKEVSEFFKRVRKESIVR